MSHKPSKSNEEIVKDIIKRWQYSCATVMSSGGFPDHENIMKEAIFTILESKDAERIKAVEEARRDGEFRTLRIAEDMFNKAKDKHEFVELMNEAITKLTNKKLIVKKIKSIREI